MRIHSLLAPMAAAALLLGGCSRVSSSATSTSGARPAYEGMVILVTMDPADSTQVGIVQAVGRNADLDDLAREFARRVAATGGNVGVIDSIRTKYEMVTTLQTYSYSCGSTKAPSTCTGTRPVTKEIAITSMLGRAFRTGE